MDGVSLVSGSEDCTARLWDTVSRQVLRTFTHSKGNSDFYDLGIYRRLVTGLSSVPILLSVNVFSWTQTDWIFLQPNVPQQLLAGFLLNVLGRRHSSESRADL